VGGKHIFRLRGLLLLSLALLGLLATIIAGLTVLVVRERPALTRYALARIAARSGANISVGRVDFGLATNGVEVIAYRARVTWQGDRMRTRRVRIVIGYGALARLRVMPLTSLRVSAAEVTLAPHPSPAGFDFNSEAAKLSRLAANLAQLVRQVTMTHATVVPPGPAGARLMLDARIETSTRRVRVRVERAAWNGPPLDGLAGSAEITIPAARRGSVHGTIAFIRRAAQSFSGNTAVSLSPTALAGHISIKSSIAAGEVAFTGSYKISAERLELDGTLTAPADSGLERAAPLRASVAGPFSASPQLSAQAGPLEVRIARLARALGRATPAATGSVAIRQASFALALGPLRDALAGCADSSCRKQRLMAALIGGLSGSLTVADALVHTERPGLRTLSLDSPAQVTLGGGAASVTGLSVRAGAARFEHGRFDADLRQAANPSAPSISYTAAMFATIDLSRLDLQSRLSPAASAMVPAAGVAYGQLTMDGRLADSGAGFAPRSSRIRLRRGFVSLRGGGRDEAVLLRADAVLANDRLRYSASASLSSGGTLAVDGNYGLARRALDAQISFHGLDLRRWTRGMPAGAAMPGLTLNGEAGGRCALKWRPGLAHPQFNGNAVFTALEVGSSYTAAPVFVGAAHATVSDASAQIVLHQVQLGAGNFDVTGTVANFAQPKIELSVTGSGFDVDAIRPPALAAGGHHVAAALLAPAPRPLTLDAHVALRRLFVHQVAMRGFAAEIEGRGSRWEVKDLSANLLHGAVKMRAAWDGATTRLYVTGNAYRIDALRLFAQFAPKGSPPISGELSARFNLGMALAGGAPPQPLCGDSTILMSNGSLGKFALLENLMSVVSMTSWLPFSIPDLDVGLPYDHITARMALNPHALEVRQLELSSDAFGLAGHGSISLPARVMDLHLEALPFGSARGLVARVQRAGGRTGNALERSFAVHISIKGAVSSPTISPVIFRNPIAALANLIEAPLDFMPDSDLPADSTFKPPADLSYRKSCSPYQW